MRRLLGRAAILCLPFILLSALVAVVDPYDRLGISRLVPDSVKLQAAVPLHNPLWKLERFSRAPVGRLILGDSSMASLRPEDIRAVTGQEYFNFAYGGGTLTEAVDTYWFAERRIHLDAVYLGIGLINFNEYQNLDRFTEANAMVENPLKYLTNRVVLEAAFLSAYVDMTGAPVAIGAPGVSPQAFWRQQLDESLPQLLHEYRYPSEIAGRLEQLAADCRRNGTQLVIVIPPTHVELQEKVTALGRSADEARFKAFVARLAPVYDLDYPNAFTRDRANFSDPFHPVGDRTTIAEVWGNRREYSRRSEPSGASAAAQRLSTSQGP